MAEVVDIAWWIMGVGLVAYVLTGGADFGGGFWHLFACGARKRAQRDTIDHALAPIWEANHVWLIFVIVMMFTAYPRAFAVIAVAFHIPITIALIGIVLRGASFVFRSYGLGGEQVRARWGNLFAWASAVTPIALGLVLGGASSGAVTVTNGRVTSGFLAGWTTPFAWAVGLFALALFALLAAVYLSADSANDRGLQDDFRKRALLMELVAGALAVVVFVLASRDAPMLKARLAGSAVFNPVQIGTGLSALGVIGALLTRRVRAARMLVAIQVALVVLGWGSAMHGELVLGAVSVTDAGMRPKTVRAVLPVLLVGGAMLIPSLWFLFRIFKGRGSAAHR